jgi:hypothetical protein
MVNYLTLILCCLSAFIAGASSALLWGIFNEKLYVEQLKTHFNTGTTSSRTSSSHPNTSNCPVEACHIQAPHSHTEAFINRLKEK